MTIAPETAAPETTPVFDRLENERLTRLHAESLARESAAVSLAAEQAATIRRQLGLIRRLENELAMYRQSAANARQAREAGCTPA